MSLCHDSFLTVFLHEPKGKALSQCVFKKANKIEQRKDIAVMLSHIA